MNREQKKILSLLKEIHKICQDNEIMYFLSPQLTLCSLSNQPFPDRPGAGRLYMKVEDMEKFRKVLEEKMPERRTLESMCNNKNFPGFYLRYSDLDTLDLNLNDGNGYQYSGMGINILPLRGRVKSRLGRMWNNVEETGWLEIQDPSKEKLGFKKRFCKALMRVRFLSGKKRLARSLYRHFCKRQSGGAYILKMRKKTIYFTGKMFRKTKTVLLEGEPFLVPADTKQYLKKYYGNEYGGKDFSDDNSDMWEIFSARVKYEDYFQETGDLRAVTKARQKAKIKDEYGKRKKSYLDEAWAYANFCGDRMRLEKYYLRKKDYIKNLYKNKDYPALEQIFGLYTEATVKSLRHNEVFVPDEELLDIFLNMLEKTGRTALKEKVEKIWR